MRKDFGPASRLYPEPVLMIGSYGEDGTPDLMNAAWGGISNDCEIGICVSAGHKTTENILARGAFTVSMATAEQAAACDYVGITSANDTPDKIAVIGFHAEKSDKVDAPLFAELPLTLECRLISYDKESCRLLGEIVNISADECILDESGKVDLQKLDPIVFDSFANVYRRLGDTVADAFRAGRAFK